MSATPQVVETVEELEARIRREIDQRLTWPSLHWDLPDWDCRQGLAKHLATVLYPQPTPDVGVLAEVMAALVQLRDHSATTSGYDTAVACLALLDREPTS